MLTSNLLSTPGVPDCGPAIALCTATHDRLLHAVIALSVLLGALLIISLILSLLLCFRIRRGREGPNPGEEGASTSAESVVGRPEQSEKLDAGNATNEEITLLPSSLEPGPSPSSKAHLEVKDAIEDSHTLSRVSSVASVHAFSDDGQPQCSCLQPVATVHCFESRSSPTPPLAVITVDDFDEGQDDEVHPEVRALIEERSFTKEAIRRLKPVPPKPGTVIPDYNPVLDEARPETMDEYIKSVRANYQRFPELKKFNDSFLCHRRFRICMPDFTRPDQ
jgi:hypothetical protein